MPRFASFVCFAVWLLAAPCGANERVVLQLKWEHAFQFAGYYIANELGYYRDAGLDVEIRAGGPKINVVDEVVADRAQYGTGSAGLVLDRNRAKPVIVMAAVFQHSPDVLIVSRRSGISSPQQLVGKTVMTSQSTPSVAPMLLNEAGSLNRFTLLDQTNDLQALIDGRLDAIACYSTDQPYFFAARDFPVTLLRPDHYGVDFYGDNLFTSERELTAHPERVKAFRAASLKGWDYAMAHPDEAVGVVQKYGSTRSGEHLRFEYRAMAELILPELIPLGHMHEGRWKHIADTYVGLGQLGPDYSLDGFLYDPNPSVALGKFKGYLSVASGIVAAGGVTIVLLLRFNRRLKREIIERHTVEKQLRDSEQRLTEAQRIAHIGSWEQNLVSGRAIWSDETFRLLGYEPGAVDMCAEIFLSAVHPQDREQVEKAIADAQRRPDGGYRVEYRVPQADGRTRVISERGQVRFDEGGRPLCLIGTSLDITEQKRMEEELRSQKDFLSAIFDNEPECVKVVATDGRLLQINQAGLDMLEVRDVEEIEQTGLVSFIVPEHRRAYVDMTGRVFSGESGKLIFELRGKLGTRRWMETHATPLRDAEGRVTALVAVTHDITARKLSEAQIEFLAHHDPLTELPNRLLAKDHLELALAFADRADAKVALLFLDLDNFKTINDSLGHATGDALLKQVAKRLRSCVRDTDTLSRQGGDEFLIVLTDIRHSDVITVVLEKILAQMARPFLLDDHELTTSLSIGIAVYPDDGGDFDVLLKKADTAMYHAKNAGRNIYSFYSEQMNLHAIEHLRLHNHLVRALAGPEFTLHYQPQIDLATGTVLGAEALIRWSSPNLGSISPERFIPIAEDTGLIVSIGEWVLREACRQAAAWREAGLPGLTVAVNLSAVQFKRGNLEQSVSRALAESGLPPGLLELELTESTLLQDTEKVLQIVQRLKYLGVSLSIDDFGTGYSSLAYLKRFNVDKLKIDQSFVRDITTDPNDAAIVRAVIQMARSLNLKTLAEGVEAEGQVAFLRREGCDEVQGYHYARPMANDEFERYLRGRQRAGHTRIEHPIAAG